MEKGILKIGETIELINKPDYHMKLVASFTLNTRLSPKWSTHGVSIFFSLYQVSHKPSTTLVKDGE